ncbi:MAG: dTDP-4-dehydrorhamnose reductase [Chitinophagales bacterium]
MKKILVTGANGQVGQEFKVIAQDDMQFEWVFAARDTFDITDAKKINAFFHENKIDICINVAAYTAVDKAEDERDLAHEINERAVCGLAEVCKKSGAKLIHFSTDFVFDGEKFRPYIEEDKPSPKGVYGLSKLAGELKAIENDGVVIRTSWVYSEFGNNFVKTMLRLGNDRDEISVVADQVGTPTYARDLAQAVYDLITEGKFLKDVDIYHYSNEGVASWYDFAKAIFEIKNIDCKVNPILSHQYPTKAKRPHYSVLNKNKIKSTYQLSIPHWRDSLKICLGKIK